MATWRYRSVDEKRETQPNGRRRKRSNEQLDANVLHRQRWRCPAYGCRRSDENERRYAESLQLASSSSRAIRSSCVPLRHYHDRKGDLVDTIAISREDFTRITGEPVKSDAEYRRIDAEYWRDARAAHSQKRSVVGLDDTL